MVALDVVKMTTSGATNDENFIKMTTFPFKWRVVMMQTFVVLLTRKFAVVTTTSASDDNVDNIMTLSSQCAFYHPNKQMSNKGSYLRLLWNPLSTMTILVNTFTWTKMFSANEVLVQHQVDIGVDWTSFFSECRTREITNCDLSVI